ncbi:MAG: hypothetical protein ACXW24_16085 [Telluria sp.]
MRSSPARPALLVNLGGPDLPPVVLNISERLQFCVDAGASAALGFFDDLTAVGLHDHIALAMHAFMQPARAYLVDNDHLSPSTLQACTDAFAAGYLGRIQQELRLFQGEPHCASRREQAAAPGVGPLH